MRKRALFALFLLFIIVSCSRAPIYQWNADFISSECPRASYTKIFLPAYNAFNGLEVELLCSDFGTQFFLNVRTLLLPTLEKDERHAEVKLAIEGQNYTFIAERLAGGQRLLLSEEVKQLIIDALLANISVNISMGRYQATLVPENFACLYLQACRDS